MTNTCGVAHDGKIWYYSQHSSLGQAVYCPKCGKKIMSKCDHLISDPITGRPTPANELGHKFCFKCGKKL